MLLLVGLFFLFCAFIAWAPQALTQALLAAVWIVMGVAAVATPILSLLRVI